MDTPAGSGTLAELAEVSVRDIGLSMRVRHSLLRNGIERLGQLALMTPEEVLQLRYFGSLALRELEDRLADVGAFPSGERIRLRGWTPMPEVPDHVLDDPLVASWVDAPLVASSINDRNPPDRQEMLAAFAHVMRVTGRSAGDLTVLDVNLMRDNTARHAPDIVKRHVTVVHRFLRYIGTFGVITYRPPSPRGQAPARPSGPSAKNTTTNLQATGPVRCNL